MIARPKATLVLTQSEREDLKALARQRVTPQMVSKWRARFVEHRLDGLLDAPRSGAPRTIDDARVDAVIAKTHAEHAPRGDALEYAHHGQRGWAFADDRLAHLARFWLAAPSPGDLQAVD